MKKLISLLCALSMIIGIVAVTAVAASAAEASKTTVNVKKGNTVTYVMKLSGVAQPIIGCDYSVYYDSSILKVDSVLDFNDHDEDNWDGGEIINPDLDGEVRGNWSILKGVNFSSARNFLTVNFTANADGKTDISYFVRYMYDNNIFSDDSRPQITDYKFVCDVLVNGKKVIADAAPELNVDEPQTSGLFVNSVTGDSKDADASIPGTVAKKNANTAGTGSNNNNNSAANNNNNAAANNNSAQKDEGKDSSNSANANSNSGSANANNNNAANAKNAATNGSGSAAAAATTAAQAAENAEVATTAEGYYILATDAQGNVTATSDEAPDTTTTGGTPKKKSNSLVLWIIIGAIVLIGGGAAAFFFISKKNAGGNGPDNNGGESTPVDVPVVPAAGGEETVVADAGDEKTQLLDEGGEKTQLLDEGDEKTELIDED